MPSRPPESPVSSPGFPAFCDNEHAAHRRVLLGNHIRCLGSVLCLFIDSCLILRRGCNASGLLSLLVFLRCAPRWDIFFHNLFPVDSSVTTTCTAPTPSIWESASQRRCSISSCTESPASPPDAQPSPAAVLSPHWSFCSRRQQQDNADCRQQEVQHPLLLFLFPEKRRCLFLIGLFRNLYHNMRRIGSVDLT